MRRCDERNQVGSRNSRWSLQRLQLDVRHAWDDPRTGRPVWRQSVSVVERRSPELTALREIASSTHRSRDRAIRAGMRELQRSAAIPMQRMLDAANRRSV